MYKILIVEDEAKMRRLLVKYITQKEPKLEVVGSAENGEKALELAIEYYPDIILTDIFMPVMNGLELIGALKERGIPTKAVIISGYDEFEYAKEAIGLGVADYLLKPFEPEELKVVLDKLKAELKSQQVLADNMEFLKKQARSNDMLLRERTLRELISGKEEIVTPKASVLCTTDSYYCTCLIKLPLYFSGQGWDLSKQQNVEELVELLSGGYLHKEIHVSGLSAEGQGTLLFLGGTALGKQQFLYKVRQGMEHLQQSLEKYYHAQLICVIGGVYENWRQWKNSCEETLDTWKGMVSSDKKIIVCKEMKAEDVPTVNQGEKRIRELKEQIIFSVRMGQQDEYLGYLEELIQVYAKLSPKKIDYVSISAEELVYALMGEAEKNGIRLDERCKNEEVQKEIKERFRHASLLEIKELLKSFFSLCRTAFLKNKDRQQAQMIVENVKDLIGNNLDFEELTLEWLAERVHFSPNYVRQLFKQKTGERVMEYVIRKRMEKAGKLLKNGMMVRDVAAECGYSNQRYFASSFKKYYGCTPTEFNRMGQ